MLEKEKNNLMKYIDDIKEKPILTNFPKKKRMAEPKKILFCDPEEVIIQDIEKNKLYEVPVRIYNTTSSSKRIVVKNPKSTFFKYEFNKNSQNLQIAPGLFLEIFIIFEAEVVNDYEDMIEIVSQNNFSTQLKLKAFKSKAIINFEPFINLGFVPTNSRKEEIIEFINEGRVEASLELRLEKNSYLSLDYEKIELGKCVKEGEKEEGKDKKNRKSVRIIYEPKEAGNLYEKIEVLQPYENINLGYIEVIATSVVQQLSVVFEEGGGPQTKINFGTIYLGQSKEVSAFLVNNGPKDIVFKFFFHPDKTPEDDIELDTNDFNCTPQEAGYEMTQRILSAEPLNDIIKSYTQQPLRFICKTNLPKTTKGWKRGICEEFEEMQSKFPLSIDKNIVKENIKSTAAIKFETLSSMNSSIKSEENICKPVSVFMKVLAILPEICLSKTMLNFWECKLYERKYIELIITNKNDELPLDFKFNKISHFTVEPSSGTISPNINSGHNNFVKVIITFHPGNFGNFSDVLVLKYVNSMYEIPIRVMGSCKNIATKPVKKLGPEATDEDFRKEAKEVKNDEAMNYTTMSVMKTTFNTKEKRLFYDRIEEMSKNKVNKELLDNFIGKYSRYKYDTQNVEKEKANMHLTKTRLERTKKEHPKTTVMEHLIIDEKANDKENYYHVLDVLGADSRNIPTEPKFLIPDTKEGLWVVRPIGKHEPKNFKEVNLETKVNFDPDELPPENNGQTRYDTLPRTHTDKRDCSLDLSGEELQKIEVGPKEIDFGDVFRNSEQRKTFWIQNNLRTSIFVSLENDIDFLKRSSPQSMVIPSGQKQGFNLVIYSTSVKQLKMDLKYMINSKPTCTFKLLLKANVIPVQIKCFGGLGKFQFKNEKVYEKVEMSIIQKLDFMNQGNDAAVFSWDPPKDKIFSIEPMTGKIPAGTKFTMEVAFSPKSEIYKHDIEEDLKLNLVNGSAPMIFKAVGSVAQALCKLISQKELINQRSNPKDLNIENLPPEVIDFGFIHIGVEESKEFIIKNERSFISAYQIVNPDKDVLNFKDASGYIATTKTVTILLKCKEERKDWSQEVEVHIRGGPKLMLIIKANIIIPNVSIVQNEFNFGDVAYNEKSILKLTFRNQSKISARIIVDLKSNLKMREFHLQIAESYKGNKNNYITNLSKEEDLESDLKEEEDDIEEVDDFEVDSSNKPIRFFEVEIIPESSLDFDFIFHPEERQSSGNEDHDTITNFELKGVENMEQLQKRVFAKVVKSKITFSKTKIIFPKTFISGSEKNFSTFAEIKMFNDTLSPIKWEFNTKEIDKEKIFTLSQKEGILMNEKNSIISLCFSFTPTEKKRYTAKIILEIFDTELRKMIPYKELILEGEGSLPRLYFDRKELIMPLTPLGFESKLKFKISNEGFDNTKITHKFLPEQLEKEKILKVTYLDGNDIGVLRPDLRMEIVFCSTKPLSRTCKLTFYDENNKEFSIMVACTADNCLFTNFSFIQRNFDNTKIEEENDIINLKQNSENETERNEIEENDDNKSQSHVSSAITKNSNIIGYNKISQKVLYENCSYIKKYLYMICPQIRINYFPDDLLKQNGGDDVIYYLIYTLTGKPFPPKLQKVDEDFNKAVQQIKAQYDTLIRFLQGEGAFLNTVFPEYLMEFSKYKKFMETDPNTAKLLSTNWAKNTKKLRSMHKYINMESWILIFYQILKIYYLNRINLKNFKNSIMHLKDEEQKNFLLTMKTPTSNVYSLQEVLLLKWLQINFEHFYPTTTRKLINFSEDISDLQGLTAVIMAYFPKADEEFKLKKKSGMDNKFTIPVAKILEVLQSYGVITHMREKYIMAPSAREMVLFIAMLYQNLQLFIPQQKIVFQCILGETVQNSIKLKNDSKKKITYLVKKEGDDFTLNTVQPQFLQGSSNSGGPFNNLAEVRLEDGEEKEFPITFKSRISVPQEGKVYFLSKNEGGPIQAAPIVFSLISKVNGRKSFGETQLCQSYLYKPYVKKIYVKCPFTVKDKQEFAVTLEIKKKQIVEKKSKRRQTNHSLKPLPKSEKSEEPVPKVFYMKHEEEGQKHLVKLSSESEKDLSITFLPIDLDVYECNVVFLNERIGEFQYTIEGQGLMPEPKKVEKDFECFVDQMATFYLDIDVVNKNLMNALALLKPKKEKENVGNNANFNKSNALKPVIKNNNQTTQLEKCNFSVESSKPFFVVPSTLREEVTSIVKNKDDKDSDKDKSSTSLLNLAGSANGRDLRLEIKCISKSCQEVEGDITLRNIDKPNDIRVYRVVVKVKPKPISATLEFVCPVGLKISQKIPIYNNSDRDWRINVELKDNYDYFKGPNFKIIQKRNTDHYLLEFAPTDRKPDCIGRLLMTNDNTKEIYKYDLIGKIEEPLAESEIVIECNARESKKGYIDIINTTDQDLIYNVKTDLSEVISGVTSFTVKRNSKYTYEFIVKPLLGQTYFGQITFKDQHGGNKWWTLKINAKRVVQAQVIEMKTDIRKVIYFDFTLENPTNENVYFRIDYEGEFLFGNKELKIEANKEGIYQLYYSPLKIGTFDGSLHIYNEEVGEFLYKLKLVCLKNPQIFPDTLLAELGKYVDYTIHLENPIGEEVEVISLNSNLVNFTVIPEKIFIGGYSTKEVVVRYTPSSLDSEEETSIVFDTIRIGKWEYFFKGKGNIPNSMETTVVSTYIGGITSGIINFKNPFREALNVTVELKGVGDDQNQDETFELMNKKTNKFVVDSLRVLQVPFKFSPKKLTKYKAEIKIILTRTLFWTFPIEGITEVKSKGIDFIFKTCSKKLFESKISLDLTNLADNDIAKENFSYRLKIKEEKFKSLVEKCLTISDLDVIKGTEKGSSFSRLTINIKFYPLRPFKTECEFVIIKSSGGQWIYYIILESTEPEPDDIINIQSSLDKVSHVSFKLHNIFTKNAKFCAYFSHDSSPEFSVNPKDGILDQSGRGGTTFLVAYLPIEYGKVKIGKLIIETDEIQWIFEVRGSHMDYKPPDIMKSDIYKMTKASMQHFNQTAINKSNFSRSDRSFNAKNNKRMLTENYRSPRSKSKSKSKSPENKKKDKDKSPENKKKDKDKSKNK